jgi:hypothetical protein
MGKAESTMACAALIRGKHVFQVHAIGASRASASCFSANSISRTVWSKRMLHGFRRCFQGLRQRVQKLFRPFDVAFAQGVDPADAFCNVLVAKSLCKFAARETAP